MKTGKSYFCDMEQRFVFMSKKYGNVTLGEINEMLLSFIGKDMYLSFWEKENPNGTIDAYRKRLKRLLEEKDSDLSALSRTDEKSIVKFVFDKILPDLQEEYSLSDELCSFMKNFVYSLYERFTQNDKPILDYCSNFDSFHIQDYLEQARQKYKTAFSIIQEKYKSLTDFCRFFPDEYTIKNNINSMKRCQGGKKPTWSIMKQILNQVKDDRQTTSLLIDAYIMSNIYAVLHDKIKTNTIINIQYNATNSINNGIQYFFVDYGYKEDKSRTGDILKSIEELCPEAAEFYCNWFRGYRCVAKGKLEQAKEYYKKAFAARHFAGLQFETFIKQAVALSCYLDFNADKVRDSADPAKDSQSPLSVDAKRFWNYGYAAGIFEQKAEEIHQIVFHRVEILLKTFDSKMFYEDSVFYGELKKQFLEEQIIVIPKDENIFKDEYDTLNSLKADGINRRIRLVGTCQTKNPPMVVALCYVSSCYSFGYTDLAGKFIELIKSWLANFDIDFSLCSDKGCTIPCEAIQQYKKMKLHKFDLGLIEFKQIVIKIIEKSDSDSLTKNSLQQKRSVLQEAIESCDIEIVKAIAEKINDIDNLRISADEDSPVYYAISRYVCLYRYMNDKSFKIQDGNINYKNLDVPGLTKEDKIQYIKAIESDLKLTEVKYKHIMVWLYGSEELWDSELVDIQNICLYLIEQTKDQDCYYKITKDGNHVTSLLFAAESKNVEICRKLLIHNANPNIYSPSFIERCIYWESWDVLAMYLKDFPEQAKIGINGTDNMFHMPLLKAFIIGFIKASINNKNYKDSTLVEHIVELFKKCEAVYFINP